MLRRSSEAVLFSRARNTVMLLVYPRSPSTFHNLLMDCDELRECREVLPKNGLSADLSCGAKNFVPAECLDASVEAVRLARFELCGQLVSDTLAASRKPGYPSTGAVLGYRATVSRYEEKFGGAYKSRMRSRRELAATPPTAAAGPMAVLFGRRH